MKKNIPVQSNHAACDLPEHQTSIILNQQVDTTSAIQFKTNLNCGSCVSKVSSELNKILGEGNWKVETSTPDKLLTVFKNSTSPEVIQKIITAAGYKSEIFNEKS